MSEFLDMEHKAKIERAKLEASREAEANRQEGAGHEDRLPCDDTLSPGTALEALYSKSYFDVLAKMPVDAYGVRSLGCLSSLRSTGLALRTSGLSTSTTLL